MSVVGFCYLNAWPTTLAGFASDEEMVADFRLRSPSMAELTKLNGFFMYPRTAFAEQWLFGVSAIFFSFMTLGNVLYLIFFLRLRSEKFRRTQNKAGYRLQVGLCMSVLDQRPTRAATFHTTRSATELETA